MIQEDFLHRLRQIHQRFQEILYVGIGNQFKRDEGVGVYIGQWLQKRHPNEILIAEGHLDQCKELLHSRKFSCLIFISSIDLGCEAGTFSIMNANKVRDLDIRSHHFLEIGQCQALHKPTYLIGIQPAQVDYGYKLSPKVQAAAELLFDLIIENHENLSQGNNIGRAAKNRIKFENKGLLKTKHF